MYCGSRRTTNTCIDGSICSACSFHVSACSSNRLDYSIDELILGGAAINGRGLAGAPAGHLPGTWRWWPAGPSLASARPGPGVRARCLTLAQAGRRRLRRWEKPAVPSAECRDGSISGPGGRRRRGKLHVSPRGGTRRGCLYVGLGCCVRPHEDHVSS